MEAKITSKQILEMVATLKAARKTLEAQKKENCYLYGPDGFHDLFANSRTAVTALEEMAYILECTEIDDIVNMGTC